MKSCLINLCMVILGMFFYEKIAFIFSDYFYICDVV